MQRYGSCVSYYAPRLARCWRDYRKYRSLKPATERQYNKVINAYISDWLKTPMNKITKQQVIERHYEITNNSGPDTADQVFRVLKALFNFAIHFYESTLGRPLVVSNPVLYLGALKLTHKPKRRQTVVRKPQLKDWFDGVLGIKNGTSQDLILFLWLTGCRLNEGARLKWSDVDLDAGIVTFQDTKNKTDHVLPVCEFLIAMLKRRLEKAPRLNDYVFKGRVPGKPPSNIYKGYKTACLERGIAHKFHDLRRTYGTMANSLGLPDITVKRLLNHAQSGNVTAGYIIHDIEDLRVSVESIAQEFLRLAGVADHEPPVVTQLNNQFTNQELSNERVNYPAISSGSTGCIVELDAARRRRG